MCVCRTSFWLFFLANELATLFGVLLFNDIVFTLKYFIYKISNVLFHTFYFFTVTSRRRFYQSHSDSTVTPWQQSRWSIIYNLCTSSCPEVSGVEMLHNLVFFTLGGLCTSWVLVTSLNETAMRNKVHLAQPSTTYVSGQHHCWHLCLCWCTMC